MSKLANNKRNKLAFLALGTTVVICLYWAFIIRVQQEWLVEKRGEVEGLKQRIHIGKNNAAKLPQFKLDLENSQHRLAVFESDMASGDVYRWLIRTFLTQQTNEVIQAIDLTPPRVGDVSILPKIPYLEAVFTLTGKAFYHDIGHFIADLENRFVHMRIRKLDLEPAHVGDPTGEDGEKLVFRMEISTLVTTNEVRTVLESPRTAGEEASKPGK